MNRRKLSVQRIAYAAILIAAEVVLGRFCSINTSGWKIGFSFLPVAAAANLFGPLAAGAIYAAADLIGATLFPIGTYHPGVTVCAALMGIVYGIFLYVPEDGEKGFCIRWKKLRLFPNIVMPALINALLLGLVVNTWWVSMLYGSKTYLGWFVYRLPEYAIMIPMNIIFVPLVLELCRRIRPTVLRKRHAAGGNG